MISSKSLASDDLRSVVNKLTLQRCVQRTLIRVKFNLPQLSKLQVI